MTQNYETESEKKSYNISELCKIMVNKSIMFKKLCTGPPKYQTLRKEIHDLIHLATNMGFFCLLSLPTRRLLSKIRTSCACEAKSAVA